MRSIYVVGTAGSGKTAFCLALGLKLKEAGLKVGYLKPVGSVLTSDPEDEDAKLMKDLLELPVETCDIAPMISSPYYLSKKLWLYQSQEGFGYRDDCLDEIVTAYEKQAESVDIMILEGTARPYTMMGMGLDAATLAKRFNSDILLVNRTDNDQMLDQLLFYNDYFTAKGLRVLGNVFNNVPHSILKKTEGIYRPILEENGYRVVGIIPSHSLVSAPTVREFHDALGGEILEGEEYMDRVVENILVRAMTLESGLAYLRRTPRKAVVTGGDRADMALAALETDTSVLILTGGVYPSVAVVTRAHEKQVPVLLVHADTYTTIKNMSQISRKISPGDVKAINAARSVFEKHCNIDLLLRDLGVL